MKIECIKGVKKPAYAAGAALIAAATLLAGCTTEQTSSSEVSLAGEAQINPDYTELVVEEKYYSIGPGCDPENFRYEVTPYRLTENPFTFFNDKPVDEADFISYAESRFDQITDKSSISVRGIYHGYGFEVIRSDMFSKWASENNVHGWSPDYKAMGAIYGDYPNGNDGGAMTEAVFFDTYIDPSGRFLVVTLCEDQKVVCEFFEYGNELEMRVLPEGYDEFCEASFNGMYGTAEECLEWAKENDVVVVEDMEITSGEDLWYAFYNATRNGEAASILIASYYTLDEEAVSEELYEEEKDSYPVLYFEYIVCDGGPYYDLKIRDCSLETLDCEDSYLSLKHFEVPLSGEYVKGENDVIDAFVLVNSSKATWDEIRNGMISSDSNDYISNYVLFYWTWIFEY